MGRRAWPLLVGALALLAALLWPWSETDVGPAATVQPFAPAAAPPAVVEPVEQPAAELVPERRSSPGFGLLCVERGSLRPVAGAVATLRRGASAAPQSLAADGAGRIVLERPGEVTSLSLEAEGWLAPRVDTDALGAALEAGQDTLTVGFGPAGTLELTLTGDDGQPVAQAWIELQPAQDSRLLDVWEWPVLVPAQPASGFVNGTNGTQTRFVVDGLPCEAPLRVSVRKGTTTQQHVLTIAAAERRATLAVVLPVGVTVTGRLVHDDGEPAAPQPLQLHGRVTRGASPSFGRSREDGRFEFEGVTAGPCVLSIGRLAEQSFVAQAPRTDLGDLLVPRAALLSGRVVAAGFDSLPQGAYGVRALRDGVLVDRTLTGEDGAFDLHVVAGLHSVRVVSPRSGAGAVSELLGQWRLEAPAQDLLLELEHPGGGLTVDLEGCADLTSARFVLFPIGPDGRRGATRRMGSERYRPVAVEAGRAELAPVPVGRYDVLVDCGARGTAWILDVLVADAQTTSLGRQPVGFGALAFDPAGAAQFMACAEDGSVVRMQVDPDTLHVRRLKAGPWFVGPAGDLLTRDTAAFVDVFPERVARVEQAWPARGELVGRLLSAGQPLVGATVRVQATDHEAVLDPQHLALVTDEQGGFGCDQLLAGPLLLAITLPDEGRFEARPVQILATGPTEVVIEVGATWTELRLLDGGLPAESVDTVDLHWLSDGRWARSSHAVVGGTAQVSLPTEPVLVAARGDAQLAPGGIMLPSVRASWLPAGVSARVVQVELASASVELTLHADHHGAAPDLTLTSVGGVPVGGPGEPSLRVARELLPGGRVRYSGLPDGAQVLLMGEDMDGRPAERALSLASGRHLLEWP